MTDDLIRRGRESGGTGLDLSPGCVTCKELTDALEALQAERDAAKEQVSLLTANTNWWGKPWVPVPLDTLNELMAGRLRAYRKEGWVLVPKEPTPEMCAKGFCVSEAEHDPAGVYRAMIAAAPEPQEEP